MAKLTEAVPKLVENTVMRITVRKWGEIER